MAKPYSYDLRSKAIEAVEEENSRQNSGALAGVAHGAGQNAISGGKRPAT